MTFCPLAPVYCNGAVGSPDDVRRAVLRVVATESIGPVVARGPSDPWRRVVVRGWPVGFAVAWGQA